jgi:hypothetical protein
MISTELKQELLNLNSAQELNEVIEFARDIISMKTKASINVGTKVYVVQKTKKTLGEVTKVNIKNAVVMLPEGSYNVPLTMLEVAA